ncbi:flagellar basal body rod C-terminal domain-containing protein [Desulfonatronum parangueonense]
MNISHNIQALHAIGLSRQVGANNVANMNTPGFKASRLSLETGPEGMGVRPQAIEQDPTPGPLVPALKGVPDEDGNLTTVWGMAEGSNTQLITEMVNSIRDEQAFKANVSMVRTWDELTGTVLDMRA